MRCLFFYFRSCLIKPIDPWNAVNPYELWLLAIMIAMISFTGYLAVRVLGDKLGIVATAIAGGLASSTLTTLTFARLAKEHPASTNLLCAGILLAGATIMVRVAIVAVALNKDLFGDLSPPLACAAAIFALSAGYFLFRNADASVPHLTINNPLVVGTTFKLALLMAAVMVAIEITRRRFGAAGVLTVAAISALVDVDAITISMARLSESALDRTTAVDAILLTAAINTSAKAVFAVWTGGAKIGAKVIAGSGLAIGGGIAIITASHL